MPGPNFFAYFFVLLSTGASGLIFVIVAISVLYIVAVMVLLAVIVVILAKARNTINKLLQQLHVTDGQQQQSLSDNTMTQNLSYTPRIFCYDDHQDDASAHHPRTKQEVETEGNIQPSL